MNIIGFAIDWGNFPVRCPKMCIWSNSPDKSLNLVTLCKSRCRAGKLSIQSGQMNCNIVIHDGTSYGKSRRTLATKIRYRIRRSTSGEILQMETRDAFSVCTLHIFQPRNFRGCFEFITDTCNSLVANAYPSVAFPSIWCNLSNRQIAEHVGVSDFTVRKYRNELEATARISQSEKRTGRDGLKINTANNVCRGFTNNSWKDP